MPVKSKVPQQNQGLGYDRVIDVFKANRQLATAMSSGGGLTTVITRIPPQW